MRPFLIFAALSLSACASPHSERVTAERAKLPYVSTPLPTGSMRPLLQDGGQVLNYWQPYSAVRVSSLVRRWDAWMNKIVIHRVVRNDGTATMPRWVTQGDANVAPDRNWLLEDNFVGFWKPIPLSVAAGSNVGPAK